MWLRWRAPSWFLCTSTLNFSSLSPLFNFRSKLNFAASPVTWNHSFFITHYILQSPTRTPIRNQCCLKSWYLLTSNINSDSQAPEFVYFLSLTWITRCQTLSTEINEESEAEPYLSVSVHNLLKFIREQGVRPLLDGLDSMLSNVLHFWIISWNFPPSRSMFIWSTHQKTQFSMITKLLLY